MGSQEAILFDFEGDAIHSDYTVSFLYYEIIPKRRRMQVNLKKYIIVGAPSMCPLMEFCFV